METPRCLTRLREAKLRRAHVPPSRPVPFHVATPAPPYIPPPPPGEKNMHGTPKGSGPVYWEDTGAQETANQDGESELLAKQKQTLTSHLAR